MSARLPRLAAVSLSASVALLALAAPATALAAPAGAPERARTAEAGPGTPGAAGGAAAGSLAAGVVPGAAAALPGAAATGPGEARGQELATSRPQPRAAEAVSAQRAQRAGAATRSDAAGKPAGTPAGQPARPAGKAAATTTDPRGNNGTFKVDGPVLGTGHGNEPHVACAFRLNFFGYDAGQRARIVFTAVAPTPGPATTVDGLQLISSIPAKGGAYGGSYPTAGTLSAADLGLDPTRRQHVKVSVTSYDADGSDVPGGAKHKVFWLEPCAAPSAPPAVSPAGSTPPAVLPASMPVMGPVVPPTDVVPAGAQAEPAPADPVQADPMQADPMQADPAPATQISGTTVSAQTAAPAVLVTLPAGILPQGRARTAASPATLPFTGSPQLLALLVGGLISLSGGAALVAATRASA